MRRRPSGIRFLSIAIVVAGIGGAWAIAGSSDKKPSFKRLIAHYQSGSPCNERDSSGTRKFKNQCAIRMSIAIEAEGTWKLDSYRGNKCSHGHARGAQGLANWLDSSRRLGRPKKYKPNSAQRLLAKKQGIVFLKDCYTRDDGTAGDHIDLWDGKLMKSGRIGLFKSSAEVWFWPLD